MQNAVHPLRAWRIAQGKPSLDSLAKTFGRSKATLSRIENGKQPVPKELLPKFSEVTGISPKDLRPDLAELLTDKEPQQP